MSKLEKLKERAKSLEARDPKGAVDMWLEVLKTQDDEGDPNPDLSVFNRIGDLFLKLKDPGQAADWYDKAVDRYAELGFHNNAIAMCNKVLRNAPARQTTYLKLAKLYAAKGFLTEAKQNFVEYAERMQRIGKIQHAFAALKEFTDLSPEAEHLRQKLEEHLAMYGEAEVRRPSARPGAPAAEKPARPKEGEGGGGGGGGGGGPKRKSSTLVFLDVDAPPTPKGARPGPAPARPPEPVRGLIEQPEPEPDPSLEIESTTLADETESGKGRGASETIEGFERTVADFDDVRARSAATPSLREELTADDVEPMADLEPTVADEEEIPPPPPPPATPVVKAPAVTPPPSQPPKRKPVVELPPLELEPDFETTLRESRHDVDDEPLAIDEGEGQRGFIETEDDTSIAAGRKSGFIDLGVDGVVNQGEVSSSLVFANIEPTPSAPKIEELEARVAHNPDNPEAHQALGEALIEAGERERGIEELDHATSGFESAEQLQQAQDLVDEILRLEPNSVRHRQKQVELAFKSGDKGRLIDAYLELADALLRNDLPDKARAVYERVAEHDPRNERARAALAMLAPPAPPPEEKKVKAKDAKMKVRGGAALEGGGGGGSDFVDLASMVLDEEAARNTRMKVEDEEPTGDEERDFQEMLARFKQGIEENIDEADFQSHYDLGVAFKEMGLLDEAIAELQKALRAPEGKPRTSEALGVCFFEKGAHVVAESILRRGLELPAAGDQERLGILYWLARALEEQGKAAEARELYGRVFAVDIRFMDVGARVKALAKAR